LFNVKQRLQQNFSDVLKQVQIEGMPAQTEQFCHKTSTQMQAKSAMLIGKFFN
jgi:hypothetical protein